eukprot:408589-Pelagomonas_calceolata.AAC.2
MAVWIEMSVRKDPRARRQSFGEETSGSTRGGTDGVEGEWTVSALRWGAVVSLISSINVCLGVCGIYVKGGLVAEVRV